MNDDDASDPSVSPVALITGVTGQDGSYLAEQLLARGYIVHGLVRRSSSTVRARLRPLFENREVYDRTFFLHYADLTDTTTIRRILLRVRPTELYHLAGQSHVGVSFENPESTCELTAMATLRLLEILRDLDPPPRICHITSSEIFGRPEMSPQNEQTAFRPVNPYGIAKAFATDMVRLYRESFGLFACNAICYNHESPRRGESFVTRKITRAAAAIAAGRQQCLRLGDLDVRRDWGYAPEYVDAMWRMLQQPTPGDFVLATGQTHSVRDFLRSAFDLVNLHYADYVEHDARFDRPNRVGDLCGDASLAARTLDWRPQTDFNTLVRIMVTHDQSEP